MQILHYLTPDGRDPYQDWLDGLRDRRARVAIDRRVQRLTRGNFGDHKFCRDGVWELRIDTGPGYRVYYAQVDQAIVLLLCGGDKRDQSSDIDKAVISWRDWQKRE
jgi:putative addiction module killer protein